MILTDGERSQATGISSSRRSSVNRQCRQRAALGLLLLCLWSRRRRGGREKAADGIGLCIDNSGFSIVLETLDERFRSKD